MKKTLLICFLLMLSMFLGACSNHNKKSDGKTVDIYYIDSKTSGLVTENYTLIGTKTEDQIDELIYMLQKTPENALYKNALPKSVNANCSFDESGTLLVDLGTAYSDLSAVDKVLCRAAIVKTLSQIQDADIFQFNVGGQVPQDSDGGVETLTADDFVDSTEANTVYKAKLYFANKNGDELIECFADINYTGNESIEELVIQQLINGPTELGMYSTIPEGTVLLNVSKADGICTIDFNEKFLNKLQDVTKEVAIYSIVNTLVELPDIDKVQFTINSEVVKTYSDDIEFDTTFDRNLNLIENPE